MHTDEDGVCRITERVIGDAFQVLNALGLGFWKRSMKTRWCMSCANVGGLDVVQQHGVATAYDGVVVGACNVDVLVEGSLIVELKAVKRFADVHSARCLNYLKATEPRF